MTTKDTPKPVSPNPEEILALLTQVTQFLPEKERPDDEKLLVELFSTMKEGMEGLEFRECRLTPPFSVKSCNWQFNDWMPEKGDVLVAAYPKTGTTWLREVTRHLMYKGNEETMNMTSKLHQLFAYIDATLPSLQEVYKQLPLKHRLWATHLQADCINMERLKERGVKILYIMRNPKDQLVSWYNFRLKLPFFTTERLMKLHPTDWNGFFQTHVTGQQYGFNRLGEWYPHHILSWYPYRNEKNVKFLYYEDLKKDPIAQVKEIAEFLEIKRSDEEIQEIVNDTSFQSMKEKEKSEGMELFLVRKGMVGEWKNHFTVAQSELMDEKVKEALKDTDIRFTYAL